MAWPAGFDPFYLGVPLGGGGAAVLDPWDPFSALGAYGPVGGGAGAFLGPYYTPGASGATRRRLGAPVGGVEAGGGGGEAGGEAGAGAGAGGRRTREPYTVGSAGWTRSIPCDFIERDNEYVVRADIPGVKKPEIHAEVHDGNVLRFGHNPNAEREKEDLEEPGIYHRNERVTTFRNRNLRMPDDADMSGELKARYEDGVLHVHISKIKGTTRPEGRIVEIA